MLLVKTLIHLDPDDCTPIKMIRGSQIPPPSCLTTTPLYDILNQFQTGRSEYVQFWSCYLTLNQLYRMNTFRCRANKQNSIAFIDNSYTRTMYE